jgi:hypothetical protein
MKVACVDIPSAFLSSIGYFEPEQDQVYVGDQYNAAQTFHSFASKCAAIPVADLEYRFQKDSWSISPYS